MNRSFKSSLTVADNSCRDPLDFNKTFFEGGGNVCTFSLSHACTHVHTHTHSRSHGRGLKYLNSLTKENSQVVLHVNVGVRYNKLNHDKASTQ